MNPIARIRAYLRSRRAWKDLAAVADVGQDVHLAPGFRSRCPGCRGKPIRIGNHVRLDGMLLVVPPGRITIADHCSFRRSTFIGSLCSVEIGHHVFGADGVFVCDNNNHPTSPRARREMTLHPPNTAPWKWDAATVAAAPVRIEDCVWLGRNCLILKGVTIGRGSIVAAGAVVTTSVPPFSVVAGNPGRVVKDLENDLD
jgi:acetyltransferase-like isoleucine patch superfamily enzyme